MMVYAFKLCRNHHDAEDLVQRVCLKLCRACAQIREDAGWSLLSTVVYRTWISAYRENTHRLHECFSLDYLATDDEGQPLETQIGLQTAMDGADVQVLRSERDQALLRAVAQLPARERTALRLYYGQGYTMREIAQKLHYVSHQAVFKLIRRGEAALKERLVNDAHFTVGAC